MAYTIPYKTGRVAILADIHVDDYERVGEDFIAAHGLESVLNDSLDALIIAGDISNGPAPQWIKGLNQLTPHIAPDRIYVIPGNHDYYGGTLKDDDLLAQQAHSVGVHFVQKSELRHGDTRFLCCTLWTDFELLGNAKQAMDIASRSMQDYVQIWKERTSIEEGADWKPSIEKIVPEDTLAIHRDHSAWLEGELRTPHFTEEPGPTVVVTHHGPHRSIAGQVDALTPAFHSDLTDLIETFQPDAWFFGHSHRRLWDMVGLTDLYNVSVGYTRELDRSESAYLNRACIWER